MGWGVKIVENMAPLFRVRNYEYFRVLYFEPKKCFRYAWGRVGRALVQFMHFAAFFAMAAVLVTLVTPCYPLQGVQVGMVCQCMPTRIRKDFFFAVFSLAEG